MLAAVARDESEGISCAAAAAAATAVTFKKDGRLAFIGRTANAAGAEIDDDDDDDDDEEEDDDDDDDPTEEGGTDVGVSAGAGAKQRK